MPMAILWCSGKNQKAAVLAVQSWLEVRRQRRPKKRNPSPMTSQAKAMIPTSGRITSQITRI
jgi:hypothetical protein